MFGGSCPKPYHAGMSGFDLGIIIKYKEELI